LLGGLQHLADHRLSTGLPVPSPRQRAQPAAPGRGSHCGPVRCDTYAERAVSGAWEETRKETLARARTGLKPETPVRKIEG
jgi:hypothetical protein